MRQPPPALAAVADVVAGEAPDRSGIRQIHRRSSGSRRAPGTKAMVARADRRWPPSPQGRRTFGYIGAMLSWLKLVTLWLLAFALPVQGWAAAAMVHCERSHRHADGVVHVHDTGETHHHSQAVAGDDVREQAVTGSVAGDIRVRLTSSKTANLADLGNHSCSACGACCSPAAMPTMAIHVADPAPSARWIPEATYGRIGFVTSGPDRPPRLILA